MLDIIIEAGLKSLAVLILGEHDSASVEDQPSHDQGQVPYNEYLLRVDFVALIDVGVV